MKRRIAALVVLLCATAFSQAPQQQPATSAPPQDPAMQLVTQARKLNSEGKQQEAINLYHQALDKSPKLFEAWIGAGSALDLMGDYAQARHHFEEAINYANPQQKAQAMKTMAISYAFERKAAEAAKYEVPVYDEQLKAGKFYDAGETADELARIYIEAGDLESAAQWYHKGHDAGVQKPDLTPKERDLWDFRLENALARIAARKGDKAEADKHVAAAKAILDKGTNPEQAPFLPYLLGYVKLYTGDAKGAVADLLQGNQRDPFILLLIAQAYEKSGDAAQAQEYYRKVLQSNIHNPTNAFARPIAREKVGGKG